MLCLTQCSLVSQMIVTVNEDLVAFSRMLCFSSGPGHTVVYTSFPLVLLDAPISYFCFSFSDYALPGYSGGGGPRRGGKEGVGRNPAVCLDRQTPAKTDMERQVTQCSTIFVPSIGP